MTEPEGTYNCDSCPGKFRSLRDLTSHYEKDHPDMIEKLMMPN
ncbi:MAG TPA: hypothetical protein VJ742_01390 [Nitrososphaera sp.]|jgi:hypothetical protein|nr:hypothetical protein [Nitrososphaera sp.]